MGNVPECRLEPGIVFRNTGVDFFGPMIIKEQQQQQQILSKIGKGLITLLSHPQIAYELIEAGGAEDILQNKNYI